MAHATKAQRPALISKVEKAADLKTATVNGMWNLFSKYYDDISYDKFREDLSQKNYVVVCRDVEQNHVQGFSTIQLYTKMINGKKTKILFSGDTIMSSDYWGYKGLHNAFAGFAVREWLRQPFIPFYWFLISKGYKTYLVLTRNFVNYWPRHDEPTPDFQKQIIETLATDKYKDAWDSKTGCLHFSDPQGRLRDGMVPITTEDLIHPDIAFFVKANPGHAQGEELCCLAEFNLALWIRFISKSVGRVLTRLGFGSEPIKIPQHEDGN